LGELLPFLLFDNQSVIFEYAWLFFPNFVVEKSKGVTNQYRLL